MLEITPDFLVYVLAGFAAVFFDWFPGVAAWFANLSETRKRSFMAALLAFLTAGIFGGICAGWWASQVTCDKPGFYAVVQIYLLAIGVNQGMHSLFKPGPNHPITWRVQDVQKGQGMVEYALILALVALIVIGVLTVLGPQISNIFTTINENL